MEQLFIQTGTISLSTKEWQPGIIIPGVLNWAPVLHRGMVEAPLQRLQEIVDSTFKQLDRESLPNIQILYREFSNFLSTRGTKLFPGPKGY